MMVGLRWLTWVSVSVHVAHIAGQTTDSSDDLVGFFVSEAFNVYTQVTSALGSVAAEASAAAASSLDAAASSASEADASGAAATGDDSASSTASTSESPSPSSASTGGLPTSTLRSSASSLANERSSSTLSTSSTPTVVAAAETQSSASSSASSNGGGGSSNNNNKLPIILGCVLGALALGLLILTLLLCCKRRRRRRSRRDSLSSRALSPQSAEVESWRRPSGMYDSRHSSNKELMGAPLMSEHPAFRNHSQHENPFVPVPPAPRRSAPNARFGLTDGMIPGEDPYLLEKDTGQPLSRQSNGSSHKGKNVALGAGAVAAGALAMHHHDKKKDNTFGAYEPYSQAQDRAITRKPIPSTGTMSNEPLANSPALATSDAFGIGSSGGRQSMDSSRSRPSRDAARANAAFDNQYAPLPDPGHSHQHHGTAIATATALAAGGLGGAALAHRRNDSRSRSTSATRSRSPHANVLLASQRDSSTSNPSSEISASSNSKEYSDAVPIQVPPKDAAASVQNLEDLPYTSPLPAVPVTRSRRNSPLGTAAPAAASLSYVDSAHAAREREKSVERERERSRSNSRPRSLPNPFPEYRPRGRTSMQSSEANQPLLASRSPGRKSFPSPSQIQSHDYAHPETFPDLPLSSSVHSAMNKPAAPAVSTPGLHNLHPSNGIVGDSRYPHMNVPRRRSGGEYDYTADGSFLPAHVPLPQGMHEGSGVADRGSRESSRSRKNSFAASAVRPSLPTAVQMPRDADGSGSNTASGSDDSTWRLSMGMPGGWQRNRSPGVRRSVDDARSPVSPITDPGYYGSGGKADSFMSGSTAVTGGTGTGRRLRLADLRRQEEEMLRNRGQLSMASEWGGGEGYDGYGYGGHGQGQGHDVGYQAQYGAGNRYYEGVGVAR